MDLFEEPQEGDAKQARSAPLAERMRPHTLDEFVGQEALVGAGAPLRLLIDQDRLPSMIFWGPPGSGKTTLAAIIARHTRAEFIKLSAVTASIKDVKEMMERARSNRERHGRGTIIFIDEIHRFNKAQQDAFLPFVEEGSITLIGATTENPSFSVISALLSRSRVFVLKALTTDDIAEIVRRALVDEKRGIASQHVKVDDELIMKIAELSDGDARRALNLLELGAQFAHERDGRRIIDRDTLSSVLQRQHLLYDKTGEEHYNIISALHKSLRGSDPQGAVYWAERMLASGEDPLYLARRMIRFASEDVGNADPWALPIAVAARDAFMALGSPEGELALIQCAVYLATAAKSNAVYEAEGRAKAEIEKTGSLPVPMHIRNAPTRLMKGLGYGKGYKYDHEYDGAFAGQEFLPEGVEQRVFYEPRDSGREAAIKKRLEELEAKKSQRE